MPFAHNPGLQRVFRLAIFSFLAKKRSKNGMQAYRGDYEHEPDAGPHPTRGPCTGR